MISGFEWVVLVLVSTALVAMALLVALWFEAERQEDAWTLSRLDEPLGLRYRVLGRDHVARPDPFVVHERPGAAADNSVIERSLVSTHAHGLPAVFEYVTYRDPIRLRRFGPPFLVLAVRVPAGVPSFRLRPKGLFERFLKVAHGDAQPRHRVPPGWVMHIDGPDRAGWERPPPDMGRLAASGLWIQVSGNALFVARPLKPWQVSRFTPEGIQALIRQALPILEALDSPDASRLEALVRTRAALTQATEG